MKHRIDPKIDCVFKALLGVEENKDLLIHFLNATLGLELGAPVTEVVLRDPHNGKESLNDKLSIVDVKAKDASGRIFQVEIQMLQYGHLLSRIAYGWTDIYSQQLQSGADYDELRPTYSIWILNDNLLPDDGLYVHDFKLRDHIGTPLLENGGIWLFELKKFNAQKVATEEQRWLRFFKEGEALNDQALPEWMATREMEKAMKTLMQFSEKENDYHEYQARQNFLRQQRTMQKELEGALEREAKAVEEKNELLAARTQDQAEISRLKALLEGKGKTH